MADKQDNTLSEELKYFNTNKKEYLETYKGQFVLIKGKAFAGSFTTEQEAYKEGVQKFGNEPFLIKQVTEEEIPVSFPALTVGGINVDL